MAHIIIIVPEFTPLSHRLSVLKLFTDQGFLNVAIVHMTKSGDIEYEIVPVLSPKFMAIVNPERSYFVFPDKLRDMVGYSYRIPVYHQPPRVIVRKGYFQSRLTSFLNALRDVQNSNYKLIFLPNASYFSDYWVH